MSITAEQMTQRLDDEVPPCKDGLYPARLFAIKILTEKPLDELIYNRIIKPLSEITECHDDVPDYKFERNGDALVLGYEAEEGEIFEEPSDRVRQFIRDLRVYGLREAVRLLNEDEVEDYQGNPNQLINDAIKLTVEITKDYLINKEAIAKSRDDTVKLLRLILKSVEDRCTAAEMEMVKKALSKLISDGNIK